MKLQTRPPVTRISRAILAVLILAASVGVGLLVAHIFAASGPSAPDPTGSGSAFGPPVSQQTLSTAVNGLCQTQQRLVEGDLADARGPFLNQSHIFLHSLAAAVQTQDRQAATDLLIAMYRVEDALSLPTGASLSVTPTDTAALAPGQMAADLLVQVHRSAALLGLSAAAC